MYLASTATAACAAKGTTTACASSPRSRSWRRRESCSTKRIQRTRDGGGAMKVDVLIPTYRRPAGLAVTLTSLTSQDFRDFRIVLSDQTEDEDLAGVLEVQAALRVLRLHGHTIDFHKHLPRRGMAEQRQFLLDQV